MWRQVLIILALMVLAGALGVAVSMYTYEMVGHSERLDALDARMTVFETVRIEAVVTEPPTVEPMSISPPIRYY